MLNDFRGAPVERIHHERHGDVGRNLPLHNDRARLWVYDNDVACARTYGRHVLAHLDENHEMPPPASSPGATMWWSTPGLPGAQNVNRPDCSGQPERWREGVTVLLYVAESLQPRDFEAIHRLVSAGHVVLAVRLP